MDFMKTSIQEIILGMIFTKVSKNLTMYINVERVSLLTHAYPHWTEIAKIGLKFSLNTIILYCFIPVYQQFSCGV
jgi:hypothetical protein